MYRAGVSQRASSEVYPVGVAEELVKKRGNAGHLPKQMSHTPHLGE
jgi:hypothetical protein